MKRIQVVFTEDAWRMIEVAADTACKDFKSGTISYSDVVNEMILNARIDIRALQAKHTDLRRSLKVLASQKDIDIDQVMKALSEIKGRGPKKKPTQMEMEMKDA